VILLEETESIYTVEDVMKMLDTYFHEPGEHWDQFYEDRTKLPFFVDVPDDTLKRFFDEGILNPGRVLEFGCGNGRNAIYLAKLGCKVDAVDASPKAIAWAREKTAANGVDIDFWCKSIFDLELTPSSYDLIYDGGCFHHIPPHRRITYVDMVAKILKPNGFFCIYCFVPGTEYSPEEQTDWEVYRSRRFGGGFAFTREQLIKRFEPSGLKLIEIVDGKDIPPGSDTFGKAFLHTALFKKQI
jgi:SAM-dependent methyltransferase